jgi:hypothetical protein
MDPHLMYIYVYMYNQTGFGNGEVTGQGALARLDPAFSLINSLGNRVVVTVRSDLDNDTSEKK